MDVLTPEDVRLQAWHVCARDPDEKRTHKHWQRQGFVGLCIADETHFEMKAVNKFLRALPRAQVHMSRWAIDHERFPEVGSWSTSSRCVYLRPEVRSGLQAFIAGLPPRPHLFATSETISETMYNLLRRLNYSRVCIERNDGSTRWMLSVQDTAHIAVLMLFA